MTRSRREFLKTTALATGGAMAPYWFAADRTAAAQSQAPVID